MKKLLIVMAAGIIPALVATKGAFAQSAVNPEIIEPRKNLTEVEKSITGANDYTSDLGDINRRAVKAFTKEYKNVTGERWSKNREGFSARFTSNGVTSIIFYSARGKWQGSLKGYSEDKMPAEIRNMVKREYYDYSITYVQELETPGSEGVPTFIVHMEDKNSIKQLRIHDGDMEVWKEFKKQS